MSYDCLVCSQALVARNTPFFLTFCLQIDFQSNFFISLLFHLFFSYFKLLVSIFIQSHVNNNLQVSTLYRY